MEDTFKTKGDEMKTKKIITIVIAVFLLFLCGTAAAFEGGTGTAADPFHVKTANDLNEIKNNLSAHYVLMNDIDMENVKIDPVGEQEYDEDGNPNLQKAFTGSFSNGGNFTISNLEMIFPESEYAGLFGYADNVSFQNIRLENVSIQGNKSIGALIASGSNLTVENCSVSNASISMLGSYGGVGGLIGEAGYSEIKNCSVIGSTIDGKDSTGGLIGVFYFGNVSGCSFTWGTVSGTSGVGGLIGFVETVNVFRCNVEASVSGESDVGGLIGRLADDGRIEECYASGNVHASDYNAGGILGRVNWRHIETNEKNTIIKNCFTQNSVRGNSSVGGIAGFMRDSIVENCYSTGLVRADTEAGGITGFAENVLIQSCIAYNYIILTENRTGAVTGLDSSDIEIVDTYSNVQKQAQNSKRGLVIDLSHPKDIFVNAEGKSVKSDEIWGTFPDGKVWKNWDTAVWKMNENPDYQMPIFKWQTELIDSGIPDLNKSKQENEERVLIQGIIGYTIFILIIVLAAVYVYREKKGKKKQ